MSRGHTLRLFICTIPATLNWAATGSLVALILKAFVFDRIAEPFPGLNGLGIVWEGVLVSIVASYIFYVIVVHLKDFNDRKYLYPFISIWTKRVVGICLVQLRDVSKTSGIELDFHKFTVEEIQIAFNAIDPHNDAPLLVGVNPFRYANWYEYFKFEREKSKKYFLELLTQLPYLDARLVSLMMAIEGSAHFVLSESCAGMPFRNTDLASHSQSFFEYCRLCRNLDDYLSSDVWHAHR